MRQQILIILITSQTHPAYLLFDVVDKARTVDAVPISVGEARKHVNFPVIKAVSLLVAVGGVIFCDHSTEG